MAKLFDDSSFDDDDDNIDDVFDDEDSDGSDDVVDVTDILLERRREMARRMADDAEEILDSDDEKDGTKTATTTAMATTEEEGGEGGGGNFASRKHCSTMGNSNGIIVSPPPATSPLLADLAREIISRTNDNLIIGTITFDDIVGVCGFLVAKYAVDDVSGPPRLSPPVTVDNAWQHLLNFPQVYEFACRSAHELAGKIIGKVDDCEEDTSYRIVVDRPYSETGTARAREHRRRSTVDEMRRLGLITPSISSTNSPPTRKRGLSNVDGIGCDATGNEVEEEQDEEEQDKEVEEVIQKKVKQTERRRRNHKSPKNAKPVN